MDAKKQFDVPVVDPLHFSIEKHDITDHTHVCIMFCSPSCNIKILRDGIVWDRLTTETSFMVITTTTATTPTTGKVFRCQRRPEYFTKYYLLATYSSTTATTSEAAAVSAICNHGR
jgi:hypothetical protein